MRRPRFDEWYRERTLSSIIGAITPEQSFRRLLRHDDAIVGAGFQVSQDCEALGAFVARNLEWRSAIHGAR
jgi:hypothetical protein